MPSKRRKILKTLPGITLGFAGCNSLLSDGRPENQTETTPDQENSRFYEPTTPTQNESIPESPPEYKVQTPATVRGLNRRNESQTVRVILEIGLSDDRQEVLNQSYEFPPKKTTEIENFEQQGRYHFTVELDDQQYTETVYIWPQQLADCNTVSPTIVLEPSGVSIGVRGTDAGCPPLTTTPGSNESHKGE